MTCESPQGGTRGPVARHEIVPLAARDDAQGAPVYLIHPVGGSIWCYVLLARRLAARHAVMAVPSPALAGESITPVLATLADQYAAAVQAHMATQGEQACVVGGWSFGAVAAHEVACRLQARGTHVRHLALIDSPPPDRRHRPLDDDEVARAFVDELTRMSPGVAALAEGHARPDPLACLRLADPQASPAAARQRLTAFAVHLRSMAGHRPTGHFHGPATLIRAGSRPRFDDVAAGWRSRVDEGLTCHHLAGADHYSLLRPPAVRRVGDLLMDAFADHHHPPTTEGDVAWPVAGSR